MIITSTEQEAEEELENIQAQGANSTKHMEELQQSCKPYVERREAIKALLLQRELIKTSQQEAIEALVTQQVNKRHEVGEWTKKKDVHSANVQQLAQQVEAWGERMQAAINQADTMCKREEIKLTGSSVKRLEANIASLERALRQQETRLGGTSEEVHKRYVQAKKAYEDSRKQIEDLKLCCTVSCTFRSCW